MDSFTYDFRIGVVALLLGLSSCLTMERDLIKTGQVRMMTRGAGAASIEHVWVRPENGRTHLSGHIRGTSPARTPKMGHIDIEAVGPGGKVLYSETAPVLFHLRNRSTTLYCPGRFSADLPELPEGTTLTLTYHPAEECAEPGKAK